MEKISCGVLLDILSVLLFPESFDGKFLGNLHMQLINQAYEVLIVNSW
jgi:hypothetical protein